MSLLKTNIGIFVTTLNPASPSQARLQHELFSGLTRLGAHHYQFFVFCRDVSDPSPIGATFSFHRVEIDGPWATPVKKLRSRLAAMAIALAPLAGVDGGRTYARLIRWVACEPPHFAQLRKLNIRLLWNLNQHELKSPVPYIRTVWEINHRIHSMFPEYAYARYGFDGVDAGITQSLARASYVITGTQEGKRQLVDMLGVHAGKVRVIPFPAPQLPDPGQPDGEKDAYLFYPSRFWPHKNHVVILNALKILREAHAVELPCVFTGSDNGNLDYVLSYAQKIGVRDLIDYRGAVTEQALAGLYRDATALLYVSAVGPDNLPPLEAMTLGCPAIVSDVPGAREQYGDAAIYFSPTDERALAACVMKLIGDSDFRTAQIAHGRARAASLTADGYVAAVMSIFDEFSVIARAWDRCDSSFT